MLERLDPAALVAALETADGTEPPSAAILLDKVRDGALAELLRRFDDPELRKDLPGTGLLNVINAAMRLDEKRLAANTENTGPSMDPIDMIMGTTLPGSRKLEQLRAERERTRARLDKLDLLLEAPDEQLLQQ